MLDACLSAGVLESVKPEHAPFLALPKPWVVASVRKLHLQGPAFEQQLSPGGSTEGAPHFGPLVCQVGN